MQTFAQLDLRANRGVPFVYIVDFEGFDYSAASFVMEARAYRDAPSSLISLAGPVNAAAQGISVSVTTSDGVPTSTVQIRINETTIEGLAYTSPRGGDLRLQYALDITGGGHGKARRMQGAFIVEASANG
jgi:hypothetical protein